MPTWAHLVLRKQGKLRVFQTSTHFHFLSLPRGYCSKPSDPQHLRSMAVFSDTAKRLWGLYLSLTRCSRPRVLTLRAGWCFPLLTDAGPRPYSTSCGQLGCWLVKEALTTPLEPAVRLELTYLHTVKYGLLPGIRLHYPYMLYCD